MGLGAASDEDILFAIAGGLLISISSSYHLLFKGRITGMSGMITGLISPQPSSHWQLSLFFSMVFISSICYNIPQIRNQFFPEPVILIDNLSMLGFAIGGILVGIGTKLGNGCTSGHGVCGMPRWSIRSFVAVGCFLSTGIATATIRYYSQFFNNTNYKEIFENDINEQASSITWIVISSIALLVNYFKASEEKRCDATVSGITGALFSLGLIISGMIKRTQVLGFLTINQDWDPSLLFVLMAAAGANFITFYFILKEEHPQYAVQFEVPTNKQIDSKLIIGASIFGIGWGMSGLCPGPVFVLIPLFTPHITIVFTSLLFGSHLSLKYYDKYKQNKLKNPADVKPIIEMNQYNPV